MTFTANGKPLLGAQITEPLSGAWTALIEVDSAEELDDAITLEIGSRAARFEGTRVRGAVEHGRWVGLIVGGAGGLSRDIESRHYAAVPVKTVLSGLMADSGETLDTTVVSSVLDRSLRAWLRPMGPPSTALDDLAAEAGVTWRVLRSGRVWLGTEAWPTISMAHVEVSRGPAAGTLKVAPAEAPLARPGTTFSGLRCSHVVTTLRGGQLRQQVWAYESKGDRVKRALGELVRQLIGNQLDYSKLWPATVVSQAGDGTLELVPDDERVRGLGLRRVPIRYGLPGCVATVPSGARVRLGFDAADPTRPYAALWDEGSVTELRLGNGTLKNARQGDMVTSMGPTTTIIFAPVPPAMGGAVVTGTPYLVLTAPMADPTATSPYIRGVVSSGSGKVKS